DRRQAMTRNRRYRLLGKRADGYVAGNKNPAVRLYRLRCHGALDVGKTVDVNDDRLDAELPGNGLKRAGNRSPCGVVRIIDHANARKLRRDFLERLQHLAVDGVLRDGKAGDVPAGAPGPFHGTPWD